MSALTDLHDEIRTHAGCGFEPCETCTSLVPGEGSPDADVVFVGEAPGVTEDRECRPFVGAAGKLLDLVLAEAGLKRSDVYITNVFKARPPRNRDPRAAEIAHHLPWLERELALIAPSLIVPLGRHALSHFARGMTIGEAHGRLVHAGGRTLFPLYHPAAGLRGRALRETLMADARALRRAARASRASGPFPTGSGEECP
jgi:uracil-DNA glycosylase